MGHEVACTLRYGKQRSEGKALLESKELIFRGGFRLKIPFSDIKSMKAIDGELHVETAEGLAVFRLGAAAEKWREKILHPKTRVEKLGLKPDARVSLAGDFNAEFLAELAACTKNVTNGKVAAGSDGIFFAVESSKELAQVSKLAKSVQGAAALWIIYAKGQKQITEKDVLAAGRDVGLKDVKVVSFSPTQTALKFVIPRDQR